MLSFIDLARIGNCVKFAKTFVMDKVTVITVARNAYEGLRLTMESVAALSYPDVEYIVVDGASTDGTVAMLEQSKGVKWISEPDKGIYDAMNKGVGMATGEWIIFMNAGDKFASADVLERVFAHAGTDEADVIYGDVVKHGRVCEAVDTPVDGHRMFFCHQSCIARRKRLIDTPFDISHRMSADFKWVKTMIKQGRRLLHVPVAVSEFDTNGVSNTARSRGLADNIRVVMELEPPLRRLKLLPHLVVPYVMCRMRGK